MYCSDVQWSVCVGPCSTVVLLDMLVTLIYTASNESSEHHVPTVDKEEELMAKPHQTTGFDSVHVR